MMNETRIDIPVSLGERVRLEVERLCPCGNGTLHNTDIRDRVKELLTTSVRDGVAKRRRAFTMDNAVSCQLEQAAEWLITDRQPFLLLCGICGNGKTTMMRGVADVVRSLNLALPQAGEQSLAGAKRQLLLQEVKATELARKMKYDYYDWNALRDTPLLGIDDLGEEPAEIRSYGNYLRPVAEVLEYRYDQLLPTVMTTNLTPKQIHDKYGQRISDRLSEVACKVAFLNPSFRTMTVAVDEGSSSPAIEPAREDGNGTGTGTVIESGIGNDTGHGTGN